MTSGSPRREAQHMRRTVLGFVVLVLALTGSLAAGGPAVGDEPTGRPERCARSPELSVSTQLADRRSLFVGDRFWGMGAQDGSYPATGFHTRGEMGGFWTPPIKLLDGIWFRAGDSWLTSRQLHQRLGLPADGPRHPRRRPDHPHRLRARRPARRTDRAPARGVEGDHDAARGRRALRADEGLSLGRDHAQPDDVQPSRHAAPSTATTSSSASRARRRARTRPTTTRPSSARR